MSVSNSPSDIVNLSLDIIKTENISDVDMPGDDDIAKVANRWYDDTLQTALEDHAWIFATKRTTIPLLANVPLFHYANAYSLPSDYLTLVAIKDDDKPLNYWDYEISGRILEFDNSSAPSLFIRYVWFNRQVSTYSAAFKMYLAHLLAANIAPKLTGSTGTITRLQKLVPVVRENAKAKNGKDSPPKVYRESKMLAGRRIYGG